MRGRGGGGGSAGQSASDCEDEDGEEAGEERVSLPPCCWKRKLLQDAPFQTSRALITHTHHAHSGVTNVFIKASGAAGRRSGTLFNLYYLSGA